VYPAVFGARAANNAVDALQKKLLLNKITMRKLSFSTIWMLLLIQYVALTPIQAQKMPKWFKIGVQAYTYRNHIGQNPDKILDLIRDLGIQEIEGGGSKTLSNADFLKKCRERGIAVVSTGCDYNELKDNPTVVVARAKELGVKMVMCPWIPHQKGKFNLQDAKNAVDVFNKAGMLLKENDITLCYHNHGFEFQPYMDGTLMDYLIQKTDSKYVSFEMDVFWTIHGGASPASLLRKYPGRFKMMHLKDIKKGVTGDLTGGSGPENDVVLGTGQADYDTIFKLAKKNGIKHFFIEDESDKEMENVPLSIAFLKKIIPTVK
jgi:sugar phosphate isomerase/epimerase